MTDDDYDLLLVVLYHSDVSFYLCLSHCFTVLVAGDMLWLL